MREDKLREVTDGFDGTWVAHPDLVPVAMAVFDHGLGAKPNQTDRQREEVSVAAKDLLDIRVPGGTITDGGLRNNLSVALQYLESWLRGTGAAAIYNLMEDAATAEISRTQVWQWIRHAGRLSDGPPVSRDLVRRMEQEELWRRSVRRSGPTRSPKAASGMLRNYWKRWPWGRSSSPSSLSRPTTGSTRTP